MDLIKCSQCRYSVTNVREIDGSFYCQNCEKLLQEIAEVAEAATTEVGYDEELELPLPPINRHPHYAVWHTFYIVENGVYCPISFSTVHGEESIVVAKVAD